MSKAVLLALDLGCTKSILAVTDPDGHELASERIDTLPETGGADYVQRIGALARTLLERTGAATDDVLALGIGSPGPLDRVTGTIHDSPNLWVKPFGLRDALAEELGIDTVVIDNDCTVGGIGEHRFGAGKGAESMLYYGVGTGIGGCVVMDGHVVYGASGDSGELGHTIVWMDGPQCGCGQRGCIEGMASGSGLARRAREAASSGECPLLLELADDDLERVDGALLGRAAAEGDAVAIRILDEGERALATACATMMNALSPEMIVIGGGMPGRYPGYVQRIAEQARARGLGANAEATRIVPAELGERSVVRGAIAIAQDASRAVAAG
jgi:glucokinase